MSPRFAAVVLLTYSMARGLRLDDFDSIAGLVDNNTPALARLAEVADGDADAAAFVYCAAQVMMKREITGHQKGPWAMAALLTMYPEWQAIKSRDQEGKRAT